MLLADTMAVFFVIVGFMIALPGLWLLCRGLWPASAASALATCKRNLYKPFLVGLPITAATTLLGALGRKLPNPLGTLWTGAVISLFLIHASIGVAGLAASMGSRLAPDAKSPWRTTASGSIVLVLTYLLPVIGWFVILPASFIIGSGAAAIAITDHRHYLYTRFTDSQMGEPGPHTGPFGAAPEGLRPPLKA